MQICIFSRTHFDGVEDIDNRHNHQYPDIYKNLQQQEVKEFYKAFVHKNKQIISKIRFFLFFQNLPLPHHNLALLLSLHHVQNIHRF